MTKKNAFLEQQSRMERAMFSAGVELGMQLMADAWQLALHDPAVMGKDTLGYKRMLKVGTAAQKYADKYIDACDTKRNAEADYLQEELDSRLRSIWHDELNPFKDRYPMLKACRYGGKKR